jgi:hypothetical protein
MATARQNTAKQLSYFFYNIVWINLTPSSYLRTTIHDHSSTAKLATPNTSLCRDNEQHILR